MFSSGEDEPEDTQADQNEKSTKKDYSPLKTSDRQMTMAGKSPHKLLEYDPKGPINRRMTGKQSTNAKFKPKPTLDHLGDTSSSILVDMSGNDSSLLQPDVAKPNRY